MRAAIKESLSPSPTEMGKFTGPLFDLAVTLIDSSPDETTAAIHRGLELVGEYWHFDHVLLVTLTDNNKDANIIDSYASPGALSSLPTLVNKINAPLFQKIATGQPVLITPLTKGFSCGMALEMDVFTHAGSTIGLAFPINMNDSVTHALLFGFSSDEVLSQHLIGQLDLFSRVVTKALKRCQANEKLREINEFEQLLSKISATYINLPAKELERVLQKDFGLLNRVLGVDACILYMTNETKGIYFAAQPLTWFLDKDQPANKSLIEWLENKSTLDIKSHEYLTDKLSRGEIVAWEVADEIPLEAPLEKSQTLNLGVKSALQVPIRVAGAMKGFISLATTRKYRAWPEDLIPRVRLFGEVFFNALMRKQSEEKLKNAFSEIKRLKKRAEADYTYLKQEIDLNFNHAFYGIVGKSDALSKILVKVEQVAATNTTVLLLGETGTGKGLIARAIHNTGNNKNRPLVQVNCAALAPSLIESELFGHEKGAFTGATARRIGRFEAARNTTLFLDEIGDLPLELQAKLLRVLEEGEFERVGGNQTLRADVRLIAATSRNLEKEVAAGRFRRDLWYRLNIFPIVVPPLRERLDDIPLLVAHFVKKYSKWAGKKFDAIPTQLIKTLQGYAWPGNIRELKNMTERSVIISGDQNLNFEVPRSGMTMPSSSLTLREAIDNTERELILRALEQSGWVIEGPRGAAKLLGISGSNLRYYVRKFDLKRSK